MSRSGGRRHRKRRRDSDAGARITDARYEQIRMLCDALDDLPDGAFLAVLEEHGVDVGDLEAYTAERVRRERSA